MNLNNIVSYKKRGKINKDIISNLKNEKNPSTHYSNHMQTNGQEHHQHYDPYSTNTLNQIYEQSYQQGKPIKNSIKSYHNDPQDEEIMSMLKPKFSNDIEQKLNKFVINTRFKAENLNMNININYNPSKSTTKNSLKSEKQLSMYLKKNKPNTSKQSHFHQNPYHFIDTQQKLNNTNHKIINFKGTFGLDNPFSTINEEPQNYLIKDFKRKNHMKHQHSHQNQKIQSYKEIYSGKLGNDQKIKILKNKKSRSLNLKSHNLNVNQSFYQNHQLGNSNNKINLYKPQEKQIKQNFRYRSLEPKEMKHRYESIDHSNFINTKSSTIQVRKIDNHCEIIKGHTQQLIKSKNSQGTLKQDSFRKDFSKVRRVLTQQSKQLRRRVYNSIKKCQIIDTSQEKLRLMKSQSLKHERKQQQKKDSPITLYLKKLLTRKIRQNMAFKYVNTKNKTILNTFDENQHKKIQNKGQRSDHIQLQHQLINLLEIREKSQQNTIGIIEVAYENFSRLKNANSSLIQRKFTSAICIFYTFKEFIRQIFSLLTSNQKIDKDFFQFSLKIKIHDQNYSVETFTEWNFDCKQFCDVYRYVHDLNIQKTQNNHLLEDIFDVLMKQISKFSNSLNDLHQIIKNNQQNEHVLKKKVIMSQTILESCGQLINYFERYQQRHKKQDKKKKKLDLTEKIIQSCILELKLIELYVYRNFLILRKSVLSGQNWDRFHLNEQNCKGFEVYLRKYEEFQRQLKKKSQIKNNKTNETVDFSALKDLLDYELRYSFKQNQNVLILSVLDFRDFYLSSIDDIYPHFNFSNKQTIQQCYSDFRISFMLGQQILLKAYTRYQKQQQHQSQMFIQQNINHCQKPYLLKLLCLDLMIRIINKSFYDAQTLIQRLPYYEVHLDQINSNESSLKQKLGSVNQIQLSLQSYYLYELKCFQRFISGVMFLIKRKNQQGLSCLKETKQLIQSFIHKSTHLDILPSFLHFISSIIQGYLGYAYYCRNNLDEALKSFENQMLILAQTQNNNESQSLLSIMNYNCLLCKGLKQLGDKNYQQAIEYLKQCLLILNRPQPHVYLAIVYLRLSELNHSAPKSMNDQVNNNYEQQMHVYLNIACKLVSRMSNNFAAQIFYLRALYGCSKGDWDLALIDIEETIEKSEQNYPKHFYLRALIFACGQNYPQAINETSIVLSLDQKYHPAYLLRSRCSQIQGNQNQAFLDLQSYIALQPQDTEIHKYAGHLLFQSGSFEDAILAYQQGQSKNLEQNHIQESDFHVYLTKSKTYFLLGEFDQAVSEMKIASKIRSNRSQYRFDWQMMQYLSELIKVFQDHEIYGQVSLNNQIFSNILTMKLKEIEDIYKPKKEDKKQLKQGKIFKNVQYHMFRFIIFFYLQKFNEAIDQAKKCTKFKQISYQLQDSDKLNQQFQEEENQKQLFISQMHYNIALANIKLQAYEQAQQELLKCETSRTSKGYLEWKHLLSHVVREETFCKEVQCQDTIQINVFSDKNKLSKYFPYITFNFTGNSQETKTEKRMKLCIPYPKVEPPEISPSFDPSLLSSFTQDDIEKKPQAPWITNERNCIKFTQEIKTFSRLNIEDSQNGSKLKNRLPSRCKNQPSIQSQSQINDEIFDNSGLIKKRSSKLSINMKLKKDIIESSNDHFSITSKKKNLHELLKLDADVESKLKKLINSTPQTQ